ncbi:fasciclin domain-containing protein [Myxosarcina sp. GI1(2024)]
MTPNYFSKISRQLVILTSILGASSFLAVPALADNHTNSSSMESSTQMEGSSMNGSQSASGTIVDVASGSESFNTLTQAIQAAGLTDKLSESGAGYTVFAPTDEAFNQLPDGALEYLLQPENQEVLQQVLSYHVLPQQVTASEITSGEVATLGGGLAVEANQDNIIINNASVIEPNIQASNGVIHGINRVLIPENLQSTLANELGIQSLYQ